jgi:hypothetical protein
MPLQVKDAKIACIDFSLRKEKMSMGYQVVVQDTSKVCLKREKENGGHKVLSWKQFVTERAIWFPRKSN